MTSAHPASPRLTLIAAADLVNGAPLPLLVLGSAQASDGPVLLGDAELLSGLQLDLSVLGVTGAADEFVRIPAPAALADRAAVLGLVGLGKAASLDGVALRRAAGTVVRRLAGTESVTLSLPVETPDALAAVLEGAALGGYTFTGYRVASAARSKTPVAEVHVVAPEPGDADALRAAARAEVVAAAASVVKDLVHTPPRDLAPADLAERAVAAVADLPVEVTVWDEAQLAEGGFGGILGVGIGSSRPPRLVKLSYSPAGAAQHVALVGKGITFDTGGLSLKPAASMVGMKYDMTGAATVLGAIQALARLAVPVRVTAWLCIAENMPSGTATRPNDVLTIRGGTTVEVLNTDAEGRLVLADGLVIAGEEQPDQIIDIATLTGAAKVAMGTRFVATMGDETLVADVIAAGTAAGESLWPMPLPAEMRSILDSEIADIANAKPGNTAGGMLLAGLFLKDFVPVSTTTGEPIPWVHLDIANAAWNDSGAHGFTGAGPTAVMLRTLIAHVERVGLS